LICPTCGKQEVKAVGISNWLHSKSKHYQCKQCGRQWTLNEKNPKILYFDIESTRAKAEVEFWPGEQHKGLYIRPDNITEDWFVLGWAAKWVCTSGMMSYVVKPSEAKKRDDKRILKPLWDLFNEADILVGHNAKKFDVKKMNWRWMVNGYNPPKPYKIVDTLTEIGKIAAPTSKALDFIAKQAGLNGKMKHRLGLFQECRDGIPDALRELRKYNEIDVIEGEAVYLWMRPWMSSHPNMGLYYETDKPVCRNCGSPNLDFDELSKVYTSANVYHCWTCKNCGAHGRTPESVMKENLLKRERLMR